MQSQHSTPATATRANYCQKQFTPKVEQMFTINHDSRSWKIDELQLKPNLLLLQCIVLETAP